MSEVNESNLNCGPNANQGLAALWRTRTQALPAMDPPIGPGDVLNITVTGVKELANVSVRVAGDGQIELPLVGLTQAAGLTEHELSQSLERQLKRYVREPQVELFVREYRSRQVGVFGEVARPGLYDIRGSRDTIADMLSQAGGLSANAAQLVEFAPAEERPKNADIYAGAFTGRMLEINLEDVAQRTCLSLPVEPGDTMLAPPLGRVQVDGWVQNPGSYPITPELNALGAVAAAGGPTFAGDLHRVKIIRASGEHEVTLVDLAMVADGETAGPLVRSGDIVEVLPSTARMIPYGMYSFIHSLPFYMGAAVPIP